MGRLAPFVAGFVALAAGLAFASPAAAFYFGPAQQTGTYQLTDVACPGGPDCVAVGKDADGTDGTVGLITEGASGAFQTITGLTDAEVASVACFSSDSCIAGGEADSGQFGPESPDPDADGLIPISGGVPGSADPVAGMSVAAVACPPGSADCIAVGSDSDGGAFTEDNDGTVGTPVSVPATLEFQYAACSAPDDCIAVAQENPGSGVIYVVVQITNGAVVGSPQPITGVSLAANQVISGVTCSGADNCFAFGSDNSNYLGMLTPIAAGIPGTTATVAAMGTIEGMACPPSPADCLAVGEDYNTGFNAVIPISTAGVPGTEQIDSDPGLYEYAGFDGVSCPAAGECVVIGTGYNGAFNGAVVPVLLSADGPGAPTATITTPASGVNYAGNDPSAPTFDFSCLQAFAGSSLASCTGMLSNGTTNIPVTDGEPIDTSTAGSFTLTVTATASDSPTDTATATTSYTVLEAPPANTGQPGVSGSTQVGQTLTCSTGTWSGGVPQTYMYQWLRDGSVISAATNAAYVLQAADQGHTVACTVTATNGVGNASATSAGVAIPAPPVAPTALASAGPPVISGTTAIGHVLSCSTGAWSGTLPLTYTYQWARDSKPIAGAAGATYTVLAADGGQKLTCTVTATNKAGHASATTAAVAIALASNAFTLGKPAISKSGVITLTLQAPGPGKLTAIATFPGQTTKATNAKAAKEAKPRAITYGKASATAKGKSVLNLKLHPTKQAVTYLRKHGHQRVTITITFSPTGGKPRIHSTSISVKHA